jgi:hypothetical protein
MQLSNTALTIAYYLRTFKGRKLNSPVIKSVHVFKSLTTQYKLIGKEGYFIRRKHQQGPRLTKLLQSNSLSA